MNIIKISDFEGVFQFNLTTPTEKRLQSIIDNETANLLTTFCDVRTARAIIDLPENSTLTTKQSRLINGQTYEDEFYDTYYFAGIKNYIKACIALKIIGMPEFADAKPKAYNGENTSNGSEKNAAIALYNNEAAKIITEYERFLNFHYKVDTTVYAVTAIPGGYEIVIDDFTMLDGGDIVEISGTKYKVDSIDTGVVTVLTTDTLYADSECVYYPFSKFINHNIKAIV